VIVLHHGGAMGHSASVLVMLAEKKLAFESREVDLAGFAQHAPAFLAVNPAGQVPVLEVDGRRFTESIFILLYLDEAFPDPPLGGVDPRARYAAHKWGKYVETHLAPNLAMAGWAVRGTAPATRTGFDRLTPERRLLWNRACDGFNDTEIANARAAIAKAIERAGEDLAEGAWLAGADYGVADIAVFPHMLHARDLGFAMPAPVTAWLDRMAARPQVREALAKGGRAVATMGPERGRWG
jgi:glutathione S-transferase